jgi:hypothetical protein
MDLTLNPPTLEGLSAKDRALVAKAVTLHAGNLRQKAKGLTDLGEDGAARQLELRATYIMERIVPAFAEQLGLRPEVHDAPAAEPPAPTKARVLGLLGSGRSKKKPPKKGGKK